MSVLLDAISFGALGLTLVFIACDLGQRTSDAFAGIDITIGQFDWYLFPIKIKRILPMIIANAQQPVLLECFGGITCTREVFRKVGIKPSNREVPSKLLSLLRVLVDIYFNYFQILHCAYSYFTVLSQFGA